MTRARLLWPGIILGSAMAVAVAYAADLGSPPREAIAIWFLLACPGMAWVRLLPTDDFIQQLSLAVGLSLTLDTIAAGTLLYAGAWSVPAALAILIALSLLGAALQVLKFPQPEAASTSQR